MLARDPDLPSRMKGNLRRLDRCGRRTRQRSRRRAWPRSKTSSKRAPGALRSRQTMSTKLILVRFVRCGPMRPGARSIRLSPMERRPRKLELKGRAMTGLLRPKDLNMISSDAEMAKMDEERRLKARKEQQQAELREAFMSREIHPKPSIASTTPSALLPSKASTRCRSLTFPCSFCSDGGTADQHCRSRVAEHARRLRERGVRILPEGAASARLQAYTPRSSASRAACRARSDFS